MKVLYVEPWGLISCPIVVKTGAEKDKLRGHQRVPFSISRKAHSHVTVVMRRLMKNKKAV